MLGRHLTLGFGVLWSSSITLISFSWYTLFHSSVISILWSFNRGRSCFHMSRLVCVSKVAPQSPKVFGFADLIVVLLLFPIKQVTVRPYVERAAVCCQLCGKRINQTWISVYVCNCWVLLFVHFTNADDSTCSRNSTFKRGRYSIEKVFSYSLLWSGFERFVSTARV